MNATPEELEKLNDLLGDFRFAMVTTRAADGKLTAHPLTVQEREFDGDLWFVINRHASTVEHIQRDPAVGIAFSSSDSWLSIAGHGRVVDDRAKLQQLWNPALEAWFPEGPGDDDVTLLKVEAESAEYWDSPGGKVASIVAFVKQKVTGERLEGDNEDFTL
ncbi:pyridoxamine 5'-phosphate oxidase family protein [Microbacterium sp. Sa4CUA7]|uniref:Pyridoxamine 5'-phosphate oxidase family protein n=1 Tax=Microbacterium pullorum TaxID=2762236 RepID=A0ABR8S039_9MICO|nr:pyridoxamine 5'-phosphate oxidase family protein [Microbacterium pullorum]MBD7956459.1 pyridoxamine 5'-phosphate oxidase family protein [Microbacterium pullorum]